MHRDAFSIEGQRVNLQTMEQAVSHIAAALEEGVSFAVATLNLDHVVKLRADRAFRSAYASARFVTADGWPIALLGRLAGAGTRRVAGSDLIEPLAKEAARRGWPVFLCGATAGTLSRAAGSLEARCPGLAVAGAHAPSRGFDPTGPEAEALARAIAASGARLCLVALGAPKQEIFSAHAMRFCEGVAFLGIGAGLDFLAGASRRAPPLWRRSGLEWLWRVLHDPRRLARRYLSCLAVLPSLVLAALMASAPIHSRTPPPIH